MPENRKRPGFSRFPMLWLAAVFAAGILTEHLAGLDLTPALVIAATAAILAVAVSDPRYAAWFLLTAFAAAGIAAANIETRLVSADRVKVIYDTGIIASGEPVELVGVLTGPPEPAPGGEFLTVSSEKISHHGEERSATGMVRLFLAQSSEGAANDGLTRWSPKVLTGKQLQILDLKFQI